MSSAVPLAGLDAEDEAVGVEPRRRGERDDVAVRHVDHRRGGALAGHALHGVVLQREVEGELEVLARRALDAAELAHDPAGGADLDLLGAGLAAQVGLEPGLDAGLADLEARDLQERVGVLELGEVALRDRADVADDVAGARAVGVDAAEADLGDDPGQDRGVGRDPHHVVPGQVLGDHHRHEGAARRPSP